MNNDKKRSADPSRDDDHNQKRSRVTQEQEDNELFLEFLVWLKEGIDSNNDWPEMLDRVPDKFRSNARLIPIIRSKIGHALAFHIASETLRNDKDFALEAVKEWPQCLEYAPAALRDDADVVLSAVEHGRSYTKYHTKSWYGKLLQFASSQLRANKEFVKKVLEKHASELQVVAPQLQDDPDIVLHAIRLGDNPHPHGYYFQFASERLRSDKGFIRQAMELDSCAFYYITKDLLMNDVDFTVELLSMDLSSLLESLSEDGGIDKHITREAALKLVQLKGSAMYYFPDAWKADREIVLAALSSCTWVFEKASEELRTDREFVWEALKISGEVYGGVSEALKADREILLEALRQGGSVLQYAPQHFWRDAEVVQTAVTNGTHFYVGQEFVDERIVILEAAKNHPHILQCASQRLRADPEIVLEAVKFNSYALRFSHPILRSNRDIISAAVQQDGYALEFATDDLKKDMEMATLAVQNEPYAMRHVHHTIRSHPRVVGAMLRSSEPSSTNFPREMHSQLLLAVSAIKEQHKWDGRLSSPVSFRDELGEEEGSAVRRYVEHQWEPGLRRKSWLLEQQFNDPGLVRLILEYGMQKEFEDAQKVVHLAPIFAAFADHGINWNGIPLLLKW